DDFTVRGRSVQRRACPPEMTRARRFGGPVGIWCRKEESNLRPTDYECQPAGSHGISPALYLAAKSLFYGAFFGNRPYPRVSWGLIKYPRRFHPPPNPEEVYRWLAYA